MKAIILAGGHATRLWPLTRHRAKPLLPLAGKPIIQYSLDALADMDVDEILISTNAKFAPDFRAFLDENGYERARVVVEEHRREENKVGSLGAIIDLIEAEGEDDYLIIGGDNYPALDIADFAAFGQEKDAVTIACHKVPTREDATAFGVVDTGAEQRIDSFEEKPDAPPSRLVSTLFYYVPAHSLSLFDDYVAAHKDSDADYLDEPGRLLEWGHERVQMYAYAFDETWHDIGTPENYLRAQREVGGSSARQEGKVNNCTVGENVWIMEGAEVSDSHLEDCIVFPGTHISDADLERCIIDEEATVSGRELEDSVIGAYSRVR